MKILYLLALGVLAIVLIGIPRAFVAYMASGDGMQSDSGGSYFLSACLFAATVYLAILLGVYIYGCVDITRRRLVSARWRLLSELYDFLASAMERGETAADALQGFETGHRSTREALQAVVKSLGGGGNKLSDALGAAGDYFPASDRAIMRAAECSNLLPQAMRFLARTRRVSAEGNGVVILYIVQAVAAVLLSAAPFAIIRHIPPGSMEFTGRHGDAALLSAATLVMAVIVATTALLVCGAFATNLVPLLRGLGCELPAAQLAAAIGYANMAPREAVRGPEMRAVWDAIGRMRGEIGPSLGKLPVVGQQLLGANAPPPGEAPPDMQVACDSLLRRAGMSIRQGTAVPFQFSVGWLFFFAFQLLASQVR